MNNKVKVMFIGDAKSGKSQIVKRLSNRFEPEENEQHVYKPTLGVEVHHLKINDINYNIWDCAGNPLYTGDINSYFANANLVFIITKEGFDKTPLMWEDECMQILDTNNDTAKIYHICGTDTFKYTNVLNILSNPL